MKKPISIFFVLVVFMFGILNIIDTSSASKDAIVSAKETVLSQKKGFFTCSGGTQVPLFKQDCVALNIQRVSFGGSMTYEAQCKDSSGTEYFTACLAFSFEPDASLNVPGGSLTAPR